MRPEIFVNNLGSNDSGMRRGRLSPSELLFRLRAIAGDQSHQSIAQRVAGAAFLMRVASAALVYVSQVLFARWMGKFEFGVYVYVWTWLLLAGAFMPLGLSSTAQRFIPEYKARGDFARLRGAGEQSTLITDIVPFKVTLQFADEAPLRKFLADRLFKARENKLRRNDGRGVNPAP